MNRTWFQRLLLSYLPVFFIVVTILFVVFFQALNEQSRNEAIKANEFLAAQVLQHIDSELKQIEYDLLREILTNPLLADYFTKGEVDAFDNIQAVKIKDDLKFNYPIIDSIYFVRLQDAYILADGSFRSDDFPDKPFIKSWVAADLAPRWSGGRTYKAYANVAGKEVVTLVRRAPHFASQAQGLIVVNVGLERLERAIGQIYNAEVSFVQLTDRQGNIVLGEGRGSAESGKQQVFASYTSSYTGWQVESGIKDQGGFLGFAWRAYQIWLGVALIAVLIGVIWVVHVTRRNYKPIAQLVSMIQTTVQADSSSSRRDGNEFGFIHGALEQLVSETNRARERSRAYSIEQRKHRFMEALEATASTSEEIWEEELVRQQLDTRDCRVQLLVLELDDYRKFTRTYDPFNQSLMQFVLSSVVTEMAQLNNGQIWTEWVGERRLAAVIWLSKRSNLLPDASVIAADIVDWVRHNLSFTVTISQADCTSSLSDIQRTYEAASHLLQYKAVLGAGRVIVKRDIVHSEEKIHEFFQMIYALSQALRMADPVWSEHLEQLFIRMKTACFTRKEIESLILFLRQHLERMFLELSKEYREAWRDTEYALLELEEHWETADDLQRSYEHLFAKAVDRMKSLRESQHSRFIVAEIRHYIEADYANSELSLDYLSEKFMMHTKSISKLFKEEFGENFIDFLIGLRIDNAKRLLLESEQSIQEISVQVGYNNYNSFNRAFKNVTGVSPRDYRRLLDKGKAL